MSPDDTPVAPLPALRDEDSDGVPAVSAERVQATPVRIEPVKSDVAEPVAALPPAARPAKKLPTKPEQKFVPAAPESPQLLPSEMFEGASGGVSVYRRPGWFNHPLVQLLDRWAPLATVVFGFLWLGASVHGISPSTPWWLWMTRFLVIVSLYTILVAPLTFLGVMIATAVAKRPMPKASVVRVYTAYLPAMVLAMVLWNVGGGATPALVMGTALGLSVSAAAILLFFRLKPEETLPVALYGSGGFLIGSTLATLFALFLNYITIAGLRESKSPNPPPESPYLPWIGWDLVPPEAAAVLPPTRPVRTVPAPRAAATDAPSAAGAAAERPATSDPARRVEPPGGAGAPTLMLPPAAPGPQTAVPSGSTESLSDSPLVESATPVASLGRFEAALLPPVSTQPGAIIGLLRVPEAGRVEVDVWSTLPARATGASSRFAEAQPTGGFESNYALSPAGTRLARVATFPRPGIQIWSFEQSRVLRSIESTGPRGGPLPEIVGFAGESRVVYVIPGQAAVFVADEEGPTRTFDLPAAISRENSRIALSPDGTLAAVAIATAPAGGPGAGRAASAGQSLLLLTLGGPGTAVRRVAVHASVADITTPPTGLTFSPDGKQIAMYFERGGSAVLLNADVATGRFSGHGAIFPVAPSLPPLERRFTQSSITFLRGGQQVLVYGNGVVTPDGRVIGRLEIPRVTGALVRDDGTLLLVQEPDGGDKTLLTVKLRQNMLDPPRPPGDTRPRPPG